MLELGTSELGTSDWDGWWIKSSLCPVSAVRRSLITFPYVF